jgi:FixJ family two-component response regulator
MAQNTAPRGEIFVIDDDAAMRESLSAALQQEGYDVVCFADGAALLSSARARTPACILVEVSAPDRSGFDILEKLRAEDYPAPVFVISGNANIPMAVDAIKSGAADFIAKPFRGSEIVARVKALSDAGTRSGDADNTSKMCSLHLPDHAPLSRRERDVLAQLVSGATSKEVARQLGISARTIEGHRANIKKKIGVRNTAELVLRMLG